MRFVILSIFLVVGLSSCQMLREVNQSTNSIRRNRLAIDESTRAIQRNTEALNKINNELGQAEQRS